ncbi:hypothetical protein Micbo1qcDRAFT_230470 [Microdochium bolleyi]|uniref:Uncharacterized protein n=1 Tax=Microdochium bolleyi TaxID=196109 RepID=A0A136JDI4_9PEZI|nr:hypothetical protein Micbo1qcDRAFT_230470 [Microdochium bolleyi]
MTTCVLLSPALPSELLAYMLKHHHTTPTTLIICSSRADFVAGLLSEVVHDAKIAQKKVQPVINAANAARPGLAPQNTGRGNATRAGRDDAHEQATTWSSADYIRDNHPHLVTSPLHQLVTSRHIHTLYMPTATHLRAYLSVASATPSSSTHPRRGGEAGDRPAALPEATVSSDGGTTVIYGFLDLHRGTSEWSAQGLSHSSSTLVEYAHQLGLEHIALIEPAGGRGSEHLPSWHDHDEHQESFKGYHRRGSLVDEEDDDGGCATASPRAGDLDTGEAPRRRGLALEGLLAENVPLLTGGGNTLRKLGLDSDEPGWAGRTVEVGRVLKRWFRFQQAEWAL